MKVNLRKAAALCSALTAIAIPINHSFAVDPYGDPPIQGDVDALQAKLVADLGSLITKNTTIFKIRALIHDANKDRISPLLTSRAEIERNLSALNTVPEKDQGTNLDVLARKMVAARDNQAGNPYGREKLNLELETKSIIEPNRRALKRALRVIEDEISALNYATEIELPDEVVEVLRNYDLI